MNLDIVVINARHFTSKKDNKVYNTIDFIINNKDSLIDSDKFRGYSVATAFCDNNVIKELDIMAPCQGIFDESQRGLRKTLRLKQIISKNGKTIDLS